MTNTCIVCIHKDVCYKYRMNYVCAREGTCTNYCEKPKRGKWIKINPETRGYAEFYRCSVCLYNIQLPYWDNECDFDYCPNCGARMEAGNEQTTN